MVEEDEVRKHGTSEFGSRNTESEDKLNDRDQEADNTDDKVNDCVVAACGTTGHSSDTLWEVNGPGVPAEDHDTLQYDAGHV